MIDFRVLGALEVHRDTADGRPGHLTQPRRLATLLYLALAEPQGLHSRERLMALFWPESDDASSRHSLRNALHALRQSLGEGVIVARGEAYVGLDFSKLRCDALELRAHLAAGRVDDAVALWKGDLAPGFHISGAPEFEEWLDAQREELRHVLRTAAWKRAHDLRGSGQPELDAVRRAMRLDPRDEPGARWLMRLLGAAGDRGGALRVYQDLADRFAREFESEPSPETQALAAEMRPAPIDVRASATQRAVRPAPERPIAARPLVEDRSFAATPSSAPTPVPAQRPRRRGRLTLASIAAAVLVVILTGFMITLVAPSHHSVIGANAPVTSDEDLQIEPALSPDGQLVAYAKGEPGHVRIWVRRLSGGTPWPLTTDSSANELVPRWSPHGDEILFLSRNHAWASTVVAGSPRVVVAGIDDNRSVRSASWSPQGDSVLFVRNDSLQVKAMDGPGTRFVGTGPQLHSCVWSPLREHRWIACVTGNWASFIPGPLFGNRAQSGIVLFPANGGPARQVTDRNHQYESPTWSKNGRELWVLSNRDGLAGEVYAIPIDDRDGRPTGEPTGMGLTAQWMSHGDSGLIYSDYSRVANVWSLPIPDSAPSSPLRVADATQVTFGHHIIEIISVSADHQWLVYDSDEHGNSDIYRRALGEQAARDTAQRSERLTMDARDEFVGVLSPDGRAVAYHLWIDGKRRLRVKRLADGSIEEPLSAPGDQGVPRWSPDGNAIAAWAHESESGEIFVLHRKPGGGWSAPGWRMKDAQLPVWSPDGASLAFVTLRGSVELMSADSGARHVLYTPRPGTRDPLATNVVWEAGRSYLWFIGQTATGEGGIWMLPLRGGQPRQVVSLAAKTGVTYGPTFASDGKRFYFVLDVRHSNVRYAALRSR